MDVLQAIAIIAAGFAAGTINTIVGSGSLITFPTLLWMGRNPILANATNTVAMWTAGISASWGFRREVATLQRWFWFLTIPSLVGGAAGAVLLLHTPEKLFEHLVPILIGSATLLLATQEMITRHLPHKRASPAWLVFAFTFQFFVGVYGGYFGAGVGILMLASLGFMGFANIHRMNGLKNWGGFCMNLVAALSFALSGIVRWPVALGMALGSVAGGYVGARAALRVPQQVVRGAVAAVGVLSGVWLLLRL